VAIFIVFLGGVVVADPPLTAVQILWVNIIMDSFAALALATEPPNPDILKTKPYSRTEVIVTPTMWRNIIGQGLFQAITLIVMLFAGEILLGLDYDNDIPFYTMVNGIEVSTEKCQHFTMIFNTFVLM